jgi:protein involved in polysaccharide export with SLBB domain
MLHEDSSFALALKQAVMAQAADEGRIVDAAELTDAALIRMVENDPNILALANAELARRSESVNVPGSSVDAQEILGKAQQQTIVNETEVPTKATSLGDPVGNAVSPSDNASENGLPAITLTSKTVANDVDSKPGAATSSEVPLFTSRPHPYVNVPALDELYSQVTNSKAVLERFGSSIFRAGTGNSDNLPMDMPVGPDYVVGPGDGLKIELWGGISERLQRVVDREGRVALPEIGTVLVAGRNLAEVQETVQSTLRTQFRDLQAEISLTRLRTMRIYVVGDVQRPGAYDISSLSTPLNALYAAGGPTLRGSMRTLRHYRGSELVQEVDLYDLLLRGVRSGLRRLESGDTVLVPPLSGEISLEGMVRRPAIYELRGEKNLAEVLQLAGGVLPSGTMRHIEVERVAAHDKRTMLKVDLPESSDQHVIAAALSSFAIQDGDKVRISPIVPYSYKSVYLDGHVFRPGKYPWHEGMTVRDLISSFSDLLPEPYRAHAEIIRLNPPEYRPQIIGFRLGGALDGAEIAKLTLLPFDTVRVFGRYEFEDAPMITVSGEVRKPGTHQTSGETHLRDAVFLAGGLTPDALLDNTHVFRRVDGSNVRVLSADLRKVLAGDAIENFLLMPRDQVVVHRNIAKLDPAVVYVRGQVAAPGKYPLGEGMTASELVKLAGGFRRSAYTDKADLARFKVNTGSNSVQTETLQVAIAKAISGDSTADVTLRDGDVLSIRQISGWEDIGADITIHGQVAHPGTYGISPGEKLSSVIKRAGGLYSGAYPAGTVLKRVQVKEVAEKSKAELIRRLEAAMAEGPEYAPGIRAEEQLAIARTLKQQQEQVIAKLKNQEVDGRLVIRISGDLNKWENTVDDIELRDGDVLVIPKRPSFVLVSGQVYNSAALNYVPGKDAGWYLRKAGGATSLANKKDIFVVRADGSVVGRGSGGWWKGDVLSTTVQPGDTIVVPEKVLSSNSVWRTLAGSAQILSALAITAKLVAGL